MVLLVVKRRGYEYSVPVESGAVTIYPPHPRRLHHYAVRILRYFDTADYLCYDRVPGFRRVSTSASGFLSILGASGITVDDVVLKAPGFELSAGRGSVTALVARRGDIMYSDVNGAIICSTSLVIDEEVFYGFTGFVRAFREAAGLRGPSSIGFNKALFELEKLGYVGVEEILWGVVDNRDPAATLNREIVADVVEAPDDDGIEELAALLVLLASAGKAVVVFTENVEGLASAVGRVLEGRARLPDTVSRALRGASRVKVYTPRSFQRGG